MTRAERSARDADLVASMTRTLVALHEDLTPAELAAGQRWYRRTNRTARAIGAGDVETGASVLAHLSPRTLWADNVTRAARLLEAAHRGDLVAPRVHTDGQTAKAWAVATGQTSPDADHGPKTGAFYANILGDEHRVTVDVWTARAVGVDRVTEQNYPLIEQAYQQAADILGMTPRDLQAAVWTHVRGKED